MSSLGKGLVFLFITGILIALLTACGPSAEKQVLPKMKNLILITLDTTRSDYLSCLGGDPKNTPCLDRLARRSCLFTNGVSDTNVTNPSHLTIMSGLPTIAHGLLDNRGVMPEDLDTLPLAMERAGCKTAGFAAISHLGPKMGWKGFSHLPMVQPNMKADRITSRARKWLKENRDVPFFMWVHYFDPHMRYDPPEDIKSMFYQGDPTAGEGEPINTHDYFMKHKGMGFRLGEIRDPGYYPALYAAEIHFMDREIGRLLAGLEEAGLQDETMIVVTADHGESLGEHGLFYTHEGLYEQQLKIPIIIHMPGLKPARSDHLVTTLDIMPTIVEAMGIEIRHPLQGISLVPLVTGAECAAIKERDTFVHQERGNRAVAVREDEWKLIVQIRKRKPFSDPELYNLEDDPEEFVNLASSHSSRVERMTRSVEPWIKMATGKEITNPNLTEEDLENLRALGYVDDDGM